MKEEELPNTSPEISALYQQARSGQMNISEFFDELERLSITDFTQAIHAANAFKINLTDAKKAFAEYHGFIAWDGGTDDWESQIEGILENM